MKEDNEVLGGVITTLGIRVKTENTSLAICQGNDFTITQMIA